MTEGPKDGILDFISRNLIPMQYPLAMNLALVHYLSALAQNPLLEVWMQSIDYW
jgi:hypothetical protein